MTHEETIEKINMIEDSNLTVVSRLSSGERKVYRIRQVLLIFLSISLVFQLLYLTFIVHAYVDNLWFSHYFKSHYKLLWTLMSVIYDAFGLLVTHRYFRAGLRVFAWTGTVSLVLLFIIVGIICIVMVYTINQTKTIDDHIIKPLIFVTTSSTFSILLLVIVLLSFKLSTLLIKNGKTPIRTI